MGMEENQMKKFRKILAVILCFAIIGSASAAGMTAYAEKSEKTAEELIAEGERKTKFMHWLLNDAVLGTIAKLIPNMKFVGKDSPEFDTENFYKGNEWMNPGTDNFTWKLGYASESIIPDDFGVGFKYARGSYAPWGYSKDFYTDDDGNKETMKVRTILLDDGTERGMIAVCSIDCIGISNSDVKKIRSGIADFAKEKNIVSVNISAIHSHMAIDSQGVWGAPLSTAFNNFLSLTGLVKPKSGVNEDYLNTLIERTAASVKKAYADLKPGKLSYTDIKLHDFFGTRTVSPELDSDMHKLAFIPDDGSAGTLLASFGAHPESTSYGAEFDSRLSSDFVYYMEKLVNASGSNFIFVQGNVGTNSCWRGQSEDGLSFNDNHEIVIRYGYELAYILLGAEMDTEKRIELNDRLGDKLGVKQYAGNENYTVWYEGLPTFEAKPLEAVMNIQHKQVKLEIDNSTALVLLKLGLATNSIAYNRSERKYYTTTEVGYLQLGKAFKAFFSPGELYSELYVGGYGLRLSSYKSLRESYGEDVILFDLMNDAAGYVCPDETYAILGYKYNPSNNSLETDSWCLAVSIGSKAASTLMKAYADLMNQIPR